MKLRHLIYLLFGQMLICKLLIFYFFFVLTIRFKSVTFLFFSLPSPLDQAWNSHLDTWWHFCINVSVNNCFLKIKQDNCCCEINKRISKDIEMKTYQVVMNKQIAHDLEPLGLIAFPQQRHLVTTIMMTWLATRINKDPTPRPVAMSESYWQ